jgi:hypothetical protein
VAQQVYQGTCNLTVVPKMSSAKSTTPGKLAAPPVSAVTGEKVSLSASPQTNAVSTAPVYDDYEASNDYEEETKPKNEEKVTGKIKDFFSNIFD